MAQTADRDCRILEQRFRRVLRVYDDDQLVEHKANVWPHVASQLNCDLTDRPDRVVTDRDVFGVQVLG